MKQNKFIKKSSAILASVMMSLSGCMTGVSAQTVNTPVTSSVTLQQTTRKAVKPKTTTKKVQTQSTLVKSQSKTSADPGCYIKYTITEDEIEGYKSEIQDYRNISNTDESDGEGSEEDVPTPYAQLLPDKDAEYGFDFVVKNTHEVKPKAVESQSPTSPAQVTVSSDEIKTGIHLDYSVWMILGCFCLGCLAGIGLHKIKQKRTRD